MKVSYEERLATDFGLRRRCDCGNNVVLSVRSGGSVGQLLSSEIIPFVCRPCLDLGKATSFCSRNGKSNMDTAESETLSMRGKSWSASSRRVWRVSCPLMRKTTLRWPRRASFYSGADGGLLI